MRTATAAAVVAGTAVSAEGLNEAAQPQLTRVQVTLDRWPAALDGFTIAQLSDFHYDPHFSRVAIRKAVDMVNTLSPDLIVLTGDFVTVPIIAGWRHHGGVAAADAEPCASLLLPLKARCGIFASLGNHDVDSDPNRVAGAIAAHAIPVLRNQSVAIEPPGARFWLAGLDDASSGHPDLASTLGNVPAGEPVILLVHEPDFADQVARYPVDLQLSGHSHGGQIRLPLIGAPFLPYLAQKYPWGLRRIGRLMLYTNTGIGTVRLAMRLNCPPEVTLLTLRSASLAALGSSNAQSMATCHPLSPLIRAKVTLVGSPW